MTTSACARGRRRRVHADSGAPRAKRFSEAAGFTCVAHGDGSATEEGEPDGTYAWPAPVGRDLPPCRPVHERTAPEPCPSMRGGAGGIPGEGCPRPPAENRDGGLSHRQRALMTHDTIWGPPSRSGAASAPQGHTRLLQHVARDVSDSTDQAVRPRGAGGAGTLEDLEGVDRAVRDGRHGERGTVHKSCEKPHRGFAGGTHRRLKTLLDPTAQSSAAPSPAAWTSGTPAGRARLASTPACHPRPGLRRRPR